MLSNTGKIIRWIIRIVLFILVLVLILNNLQKVQFNFYGLYTWDLPLIALVAAFLLIGIIVGLIFGFMRSLELRSRIKLLKADLEEARKPKSPTA